MRQGTSVEMKGSKQWHSTKHVDKQIGVNEPLPAAKPKGKSTLQAELVQPSLQHPTKSPDWVE